jgi:DNA anti-recombination protein RmuC
MIASEIEDILRITDASFLAEIVCGAILIVFVLAVIFSMKSIQSNFVAYTPALLTTLGIFGTFAGIVIGLMLFDVDKIDESIKGLLGGLKTAFVTSLFGILASILFKGLQSLGIITPKKSLEQIDTATPEDILGAITSQNKALDTLVVAIGGDSDGSLVSQMKLLRGDVNDSQKQLLKSSTSAQEHLGKIENQLAEQQENFTAFSDKLWIKMQDFADMLSKSATETVIEALKQVITDFNKNLTEQFGENFKQLNEAVKDLVVWQNNYKLQISDMVAQYKLGVESITATETSVAAISTESQVIPKTMNDLKDVMTVNQHQLSELEAHLQSFKDIRDRAVEAVPEIRKQVQKTVDTISDSVTTANKHYESLLTETDKYIEKTTGSIADSVTAANKHYENLLTETDEHIKKTTGAIADSVSAANKHYETLITESDKYIQAHIVKSNELLDKFVKNTNEGVETIGEKLAESASKVEKVIIEGATGFSESVHSVNAGLTNTSNHVSEQSEVVSTQLKEASKEMNENVRDMVNGLIEESKAIATTLIDANKDLAKDTGSVRDVVVENIGTMQKRLESSLDDVFSAQTQHMSKVFSNIDAGLKDQVGKTGDAVGQQVDILDKSMQEELNRSMKLLGDNLGAITGKFTSDYQQLVKQMQTVISTEV